MQRIGSTSLPRLFLRAGLALGLAIAGQAVVMPSASAANLTVNSTADVATNFGACGNPAQLTSSGSLREAVCAANNAGATSSTINVAAGTYTLTNGELQMGKVSGSNITLTGAGAGSTIISGNNASRVFDLDPSVIGGVTTSISGVTITNGAVTTFGGAGIIAGSGNSTTRDVLTLSNSVISNNRVNSTTTNKYGGGVEFQGGSLTVTNTTFSGNNSGSSSGSGLEYQHFDVASGEQLTVSGSTFSGNNANASVANINVGGALHTSGVSAGVSMSVTNSVFTGNTVTGSGTGIPQGGAIFSEGGGLTVTESTFTSNSVAGGSNPQGGAISVLGGTAQVHYNRITGNTGATGSGVSLGVASGATLDATNNWWGCNTGPGTAGCDSAAGGPTVSPRLVLTATASPATVVGPNATSTITATLTQNSLGSAIGTANLDAFAGLPIGFSDPLPSGATLTASSVNLSAGSASTTYNSQNTSGPGHVLATLDNGTATATVTVNRPPAITSANSASFKVGTAGSFTVTTTGYPAPALTETGAVPAGLTFHDNGNGTATLSGTPSAGSGGTYSLSLTANNGVAPNATQTLTVTVQQAPAFTNAATATFQVGTAGSFSITTSGFPTVATITESGTLPAGITFTDNGNGTATLAGTPMAGSGGTYPVTLTATNGVTPNATQNLTINVNQAPAITTNPSDQSVTAGASVSFTAAASGFPTPTVQWQRSTDGGTTFTNIAGATSATYTFTAAAGDNGNSYRAVFTNSAGSATSTAATLTVGSVPVITSVDHASFSVGTAGSFTVTTTGVPNPTMTETGPLPSGVSFTDNGDGTATIAGTPAAGTGGAYTVTLKATNASGSDSQTFTLTVNQSPAITSADHTTFQAGTAGSFTVTTAPGFPTATTITETGTLPSGVTFTDNGDGTATIAGTPAAGTAGSYPITIKASNGATPDATQSFTLTVTEASAITSVDHATFAVGSAGSFTVTTSPTADTVTETGPLPSGVSFTDNGDGTATIAGTPAAGTGGAYTVTLKATNASGSNSQTFTLTVNQSPAITSADHTTFTVGTAGSFTVTTTAGFPVATTVTKTGTLPSGVTFTDNGDGTATIAGTPAAGTAGSYPITIKASNGATPDDSQSFTLTVQPASAPPTITSADHTTFTVGSAGSFTVTSTPGVPATTTMTETGTLPSGVTFTDNGDGTATLAGTPAAGSGGTYTLTLKATNTTGSDTQTFTLTVTEKPAITSADHTTFTVGAAGSFTVTTTAGYPAATTLTKTGTLPAGVSFTDNGDGTATLAGTPATGTDGSYPLTITATNAVGSTQQSFTLTVQPANSSPVITSADHATFTKGSAGSFTVTTTAGYPTATTITKTGTLPAGVTFTDNHDGTATIAGTPTVSGSFPITIKASNGASTDATQSFTLTVNAPPVITSANTVTFTSDLAGQSFTVTTTAGFPTTTTLTETGALPAGVTFTDNHNGTATIAGTPSVPASTNYPIVIKASNGVSPDASQNFTLKVTKVAAVALPAKAPKPNGKLGGVPAKIYVNQVLTVTGTGYKPGAPIEIGWYYSSSTGTKLTVLAHGYATASGSFSISVKVINNTGSKTMMAAGLDPNGKARYLSADTVVNPPLGSISKVAPITATSTGGTTAPIVSGEQRTSVASAGALALTGFVLMLFGRRRRVEEE